MEQDDSPSLPQDSPTADTLPSKQPKPSATTQRFPLTILLVVLIALLLIALLAMQWIERRPKEPIEQNARLDLLKNRNAELLSTYNLQRQQQGLPPLPPNAHKAQSTAERLRRDALSLADLASRWREESERQSQLLLDLQKQIAQRDANAKRLYARIGELQNQADLGLSAGNQVRQLSESLKIANEQIESYRRQIAQHASAPSQADIDLLKEQRDASLEERNKLQLRLDELLTQKNQSVDQAQYDALLSELKTLRLEASQNHYTIQELRTQLDSQKLFVEKENALPKEASALFAKLKTLENSPDLEAAYRAIAAQQGARVIHRQTFGAGSSQIPLEVEKMLKNLLAQSQDTPCFYLVVGYASTSGTKEGNYTLSARRATTIASIVNTLKSSNQQVRAVYLGETSRFSHTQLKDNQLCEIWEIRP